MILESLEAIALKEPIPLTPVQEARLEDFIRRMAMPEIQQFVVLACTRYHTPETLDTALDAADMLISYLKGRGMYSELRPNKQTDTAIAAVLMHNIFFDREALLKRKEQSSWVKIFDARKNLEGLAKDLIGCDYQYDGYFDYIFQIIEAQLGELMPVAACRPVNGQITYIVWEVLWFFYEYQYGKQYG